MAITASEVAVGTSAAALNDGEADGQTLAVRNLDTVASVVLGPSTVTATGANKGYTLPALGSVTLALSPSERLYGIAAAGTVAVAVLRTGVG